MQNKSTIKGLLMGLGLVLITSIGAFSQDGMKPDKVLLNDGKILEGQVVERDDSAITFRAEGDTTHTIIALTDITRIDFADGKIWQLSFGTLDKDAEDWQTKMAKYKNKVAVLPFVYEDHFNQHVDENMSLQVQLDCIKDIERVNNFLMLQDLDSVNAKLVQHSIDWRNIKTYLPAEIADVLEVEYVVYGSVTVTPIGKPNPEEDSFGTENQTLETPQGRREGASINEKRFETIVDLNIYNVLGETVYTNAHESFWQTPDAYHINLDYLVNESPMNMHVVKTKAE